MRENSNYSILILTYNESCHLPRLLNSTKELNAPTFIIDSYSDDKTIEIAKLHGCTVLQNKFTNHPKQWDFALTKCPIQTEWVICLDADQIISDELKALLLDFNPSDYESINGIYFNRKNYFKGKWIRFGGYFPKYMLKMFRLSAGKSDLNENMDHRFIVEGKTIIWKKGYLLEENLKENEIRFWIEKHNKYSDLVAKEEFERLNKIRKQATTGNLLGSPDQKIAFFKNIWWKMPLYLRPFIYFFYRYVIKLGFLDGKSGSLFHFLQAFWFRLIIDIKLDELRKNPIKTKK